MTTIPSLPATALVSSLALIPISQEVNGVATTFRATLAQALAAAAPIAASTAVRSNKVAVLGDSRGGRAFSLGGTAYSVTNENFLMWAQQDGGGFRFYVDADGAFGVSGERTTDILARSAEWMAWAQNEGGTVVIVAGRNDNQAGVIPKEETLANLFLMRDMLLAVGCRVVMTTDTPQGDDVFPASTLANPERHIWMRDRILARAMEAPGRFFVVDTWSGLANPAATNGNAISGNLVDGTHNSVLGARKIGALCRPALEAIYPYSIPVLPVSSATYDVDLNPAAPLNVNPMLIGTGGTLAGGATGFVANGWTLTAGVGCAVAGSKVTDADGAEWQRIAVSGTASGQGTAASFTTPPVSAAFHTPADRFYLACELRVSSGSTINIGQIAPAVRAQIDGINVNTQVGRRVTTALPNEAYARRIAVTPRTPVANATQTGVSARLDIDAFTNGTVGVTVDVRAVALRKA